MIALSFDNKWVNFLKAYPLIEVALLGLFSVSLYIQVYYVIFFLVLMGVLSGLRRFLRIQLPILLFWALFLILYQGRSVLSKAYEGKVKISFYEESLQKGYFGSFWCYKGKVSSLDEKTYRNLPVTYYRKSPLKSLSGAPYYGYGIIKKKEGYGYQLKMKAGKELTTKRSKWSLAHMRYLYKKKYRLWLEQKFKDKEVSEFFLGLTTGELSNPLLSFTFSRLGLNHLLAISGFHFGLLVLFLGTLLHFCPYRGLKIASLAFILSLFSLFVGLSPSLYRAWMMVLFYLGAYLLERPVRPLNLLAAAFILSILKEPLIVTHLGFQYSFLITLSILLYYPLLKKLYEPSKLGSVRSWILSALYLGLAVHLIALPITLYAFHKFYCLGYLANLFIPPIVAALLTLFLISLCFSVIPWVSLGAFWLFIQKVTRCLLKTIDWVPMSWDWTLRVPLFPLALLWSYGALFFLLPIFIEELFEKRESKKEAWLLSST